MLKTLPRRVGLLAALAAALLASGCASMDRCDRNTAVGAAVGGVAGSVLTDQSTLGSLAIHPAAGHDLPLDDTDWVIAQLLR